MIWSTAGRQSARTRSGGLITPSLISGRYAIIIDDHSRAIAGFSFSFNSPSTLLTSLALRQAIWRKADVQWIVFGIPEVLYTDNGSDFISIHPEQVAADIKLQLIFSAPGHPRGRGRIERLF